MKDVIVRWVQTIGATAFIGTMVATSTGCGALSAAANPKVAWALNDPAPMSVVVRRADVAEKTAQQVDRVMTDTPTNDDSPWLAKVAPADAPAQLAELRAKNELYAAGSPGQASRIVPAEVWAKSLAAIEPKTPVGAAAKAAPAPAAAPAAKKLETGEEPAAPAPVAKNANAKPDAKPEAKPEAEPVAEKAEKPTGKKGGKKGKGAKQSGAIAKNDAKPTGGKGSKKGAKNAKTLAAPEPAPEPIVDPNPAPVVAEKPAAAPGPAAPAAPTKYTSLLAAIDKDLGVAWGEIMEKKKAMGELKAQIAALETANDAKGVSEAEKKANEKTIKHNEKEITKLEKAADKLCDAFIPKAKAAAAKAPADVRDHFGAVLVNLQQAVDDAKTANGAAAVRYPMAATSLIDSAKQMAAVYVADVIEEKTGKRPSTQGLQPGVTMEGGKVAITLNGLSQADMGKLSMGEVTSEVATRTTKWVTRAMGLLGTISATSDVLSFENDVLSALIDGFKSSGWAPPAAAVVPDGAPGAAGAAATPRS